MLSSQIFMKKYSIVIITSNKKDILLKCINKLKEYEVDKFAYIIVVEASDDEQLINIDEIKYIKIPISERGFSNQRNIGLENAKGEYVIFIDDDVEITKDWFKEITKPLAENKFGAMGTVFPKIENANLISFSIGVMGHPGGGFRLHNYSKGRNIELSQVATCNTIFKKQIIKDVGMFNLKNKFGGEDSDLCLRVIKNYGTKRFIYMPNALVYHDTHRNFFKAISWYIRRGKADIDLLFIYMIHLDYILRTSILIKFLIFFIIGLIFDFRIFLLFCIFWYFYQIYKHFFMVKYFKIYNFSFFYKTAIFLLFPLLKFIFDFSFDTGRLIQTFNFIINRITKKHEKNSLH